MESEKYRITKIAIILIPLLGMTGCGWQFSAFEYASVIEADPPNFPLENIAVPDIEDDENTLPDYLRNSTSTPFVSGNPVADVFITMLNNSGAIDAAKTISVCIVGDPAAIGAFRINSDRFKKISVTKKVFVIKTKDAK